ncbi:MAG TPA: glucan biosynthesis protein [Azoarcus sp.]|nr:glucan biosynthesis protein [Azoarcus sp.]
MNNPHRRHFLQSLTAAAAAGLLPPGLASAFAANPSVQTRPFSFDTLIERARERAAAPYRPRTASDALSRSLAQLDYDAYQKIRFDPQRALWRERKGASPVGLFHQHAGAQTSVDIHLVENGQAHTLAYDPSVFEYTGKFQADDLPDDAGWAGFRVLHADQPHDWLAFMGASYFRSAGPLDQYGLSARGIAINTALNEEAEEFPEFTAFWLEPRDDGGILIHALMEGPSCAGAMRIDCAPPNEQNVAMDVSMRLFTRQEIRRLGVAPLTSMFWYSETNREEATDWRPEVHDNDGLALWTGPGERIWRPLDNPKSLRTSSFADRNPRGFGLMQRDRAFAHYQDDGVFYERRPALWIEPQGEWGEGFVQLVEIPTDDEIYDNIVAYWTTDRPIPAGEALNFDYRMHWMVAPVFGEPSVGHAIASRTGRAGVPGQPRPEGGMKYSVDFTGGELANFTSEQGIVRPVVEATHAKIDNPYALRVAGTDHWRLIFDLFPEGNGPVDVRAYLAADDQALTETWMFTHRERRF